MCSGCLDARGGVFSTQTEKNKTFVASGDGNVCVCVSASDTTIPAVSERGEETERTGKNKRTCVRMSHQGQR
jgi:hypothetical protein